MTSQVPSLCLSCQRLGSTNDPSTGTALVVRCSAYPDGIPADIGSGADHRRSRGDEAGGRVYELAAGEAARADFEAWRAFAAA